MTRRVARLGAVLCMLSGLAVAHAPPAAAVLPDRVGWWNKAQQVPILPGAGPVNAPLPPNVATDDLPVGADGTPEGYLIAALRYVVPPGASAKLTLVDTNGRALAMPPGTSISVCPTTSAWDGLINGRWDVRPKYDCTALSAVSTPTDGGLGLTWDLPPSFQISPGAIDVALVPSGTAAPFTAVFAGPTDGSLLLTDVPETAEEANEAFSDAPAFSDSGGSFDFGFSAAPGEITDFTSALPDLSATGNKTLTSAPARRALRTAGSPLKLPDTRAERTLAFLLLVALGAGLFWFGGQPARAPRLLGSLGGGQEATVVPGVMAGVGRFARPRGGRG